MSISSSLTELLVLEWMRAFFFTNLHSAKYFWMFFLKSFGEVNPS